jgi:hypothetical protein
VRVELPDVSEKVFVDAFVPCSTFDGRILSFDFLFDIGLEFESVKIHLDLGDLQAFMLA